MIKRQHYKLKKKNDKKTALQTQKKNDKKTNNSRQKLMTEQHEPQ